MNTDYGISQSEITIITNRLDGLVDDYEGKPGYGYLRKSSVWNAMGFYALGKGMNWIIFSDDENSSTATLAFAYIEDEDVFRHTDVVGETELPWKEFPHNKMYEALSSFEKYVERFPERKRSE